MKKISALMIGIYSISVTATSSASCGETAANFTVAPFAPVFIANAGQFDQYANSGMKPFYGSQLGNTIILFHKNSVEFIGTKCVNREGEGHEGEREEERSFETFRQSLNFLNANTAAAIVASQPVKQYFTYPDPLRANVTIRATGSNAITIQNIYHGIDVSYAYYEGGLKYTFLVHPGADAGQIKMQWAGVSGILKDNAGDLIINSRNDAFTDKAPKTFYAGEESHGVESSFSIDGNTVSFEIQDYDASRKLVIDPWITNPNFTIFNSAYDVLRDKSGNIYIYGGATPYQVQKFDSTGAPLWTYNTSAQGYYGDFTIDTTDHVYCIYGPWTNQCVKLSPAGAVVWTSINPSSAGNIETYRICRNPVTSQLVVVGMEIFGGYAPMAETIDPVSGVWSVYYHHPTCYNGEARSLAIDANGDIFSLIFSSGNPWAQFNLLWKMDAAFTTTGSVTDGYLLGELEQSNTDTWYSGYNGAAVCSSAVYTYDGETVKKWDKTTLALLDSVIIPGGMHYQTAGLCIDSCENLFVGGPSGIFEFDSTLTLITSVATPGAVYDVALGNIPGEILGCGDGFVGTFSFPACSLVPMSIFTAPNHICPGTCTDFINLSVNANSFLWTFTGANPSVSTDVSPTNICYNTPGSYSVQLIATGAGGSDTLTLNNFITVYPYPPPQGITQSGDTLFANPGAVTYQWYHNGNLIPGATDYFYVATGSGNFNVVATDLNDCEVEAVIYDVIAGLGDQQGDVQFSIFPNPVYGMITIVTNGFTARSVAVKDVLGKQVMPLFHPSGSGLIELDCSVISPGIYFVEMSFREKIYRSKFIKH